MGFEILCNKIKLPVSDASEEVSFYGVMQKISGICPFRANSSAFDVFTWPVKIFSNPLRIVFANDITWMCVTYPTQGELFSLVSNFIGVVRIESDKPPGIRINSFEETRINITIFMSGSPVQVEFCPCRRLIVSSGDISDVDGLYALAKYAVTGADVVFVMNYPAYLGVSTYVTGEASDPDVLGPGRGYLYNTESYLNAFVEGLSDAEKTGSTYKNYVGLFDSVYSDIADLSCRVKQILTDLSFYMVSKVWDDIIFSGKGDLYFCVGGVNFINPFSKKTLKNEMFVYADLVSDQAGGSIISKMKRLSSCEEEVLILKSGESCGMDLFTLLRKHTDIYVDFNGSMAFYNDTWIRCMDKCSGVIRGAFVMGGVYSYATPCTMPSIKGVLNRFSCCTMNQLYHPVRTKDFFTSMNTLRVRVYIVANNAVGDQSSFDDQKRKTNVGWSEFMCRNFRIGADNHQYDTLKQFADVYYNCKYAPPRRAFDFYTATALVSYMYKLNMGTMSNLYFDCVYGVTLVSGKENWGLAVIDYESRMDLAADGKDGEFIACKKMNFRKELDILKKMDPPSMIRVYNTDFIESSGILCVSPPIGTDFIFEIGNILCWEIARTPGHVSLFTRLTGSDLDLNDRISLRFGLSASLNRISVCFFNGLLLYSDIPTRVPGGNPGGGISSTDDWRNFMKLYNEEPDLVTARVKSFFSDHLELDLKATGKLVEMRAVGGDDYVPVKSVVVSFRLQSSQYYDTTLSPYY